jgi:hypothetical protein
MSTLTSTTTTPVVDSPRRSSRALQARRGFLVASPVLAGIGCVIGAYADPAVGLEGQALWDLYTANPKPLQFKSLGFHWGYAFWIVPALLIASYVRGKGAWLANIAAFLGFVGISTLPGLLFVDWYDSAAGQVYGPEAPARIYQLMQDTMWGPAVFTTPGMVGFVLALPLAAVALWRAGKVSWWAPASVVAGFAAFILSGITWWGCAITTVCFTVFAVALARATSTRR